LGNYVGIQDCRSAVMSGLNLNDCGYGCLGLGSCVTACPQDAIKVVNGVAVVNENKCIGCGLCTTKCDFNAIHLFRERPNCSNMIVSEKKIPPILGNFAKRTGKVAIRKLKEAVTGK
jgi:Fe-S-cluster-containing hydrogenase component 2